ncbi:MAG TPA: hypothetical protein VFZ26_05570 [Gemmatimonadales bacterium]
MMAGAAVLVAGVALTDDMPARRVGAAGLVALGLGLAALQATEGAPGPGRFLLFNTGLLALGTALGVGAAVLGMARARGRARAGPVLLPVGIGLLTIDLVPFVAQAGALGSIAVAGGIAAVAAAGARLGRGAGDILRRHAQATLPATASPAALAALALGALLVGAAGHIAAVIAGAMACGWAAWLSVPSPARPHPVAPTLVFLLLATAFWLVATIAGPEGLSLAAIPWLPLSPAAERLLALPILASAWVLSGQWPFRQPAGGALTGPVGGVMLVRLGTAVPAGLAHWQAAVFPLLVLGIWHAALTRRLTPLAVGGAMLGVVSLDPRGHAGAGSLFLAAVAIELGRRLPGPAERLARIPIALAAAWGALNVAVAGLGTEVVYTVLASAGAALGLAGSRSPR